MIYIFTSLLLTSSKPILPCIFDHTGTLTMLAVGFGKWTQSTGHIISSTRPFSSSFLYISPDITAKSSMIRLIAIIDTSGELYISSKLKLLVESFQTMPILKKLIFNFLAALHFNRFKSLGAIISVGKLSMFWKRMLWLDKEWLETTVLLLFDSALGMMCIFTKFLLRIWY